MTIHESHLKARFHYQHHKLDSANDNVIKFLLMIMKHPDTCNRKDCTDVRKRFFKSPMAFENYDGPRNKLLFEHYEIEVPSRPIITKSKENLCDMNAILSYFLQHHTKCEHCQACFNYLQSISDEIKLGGKCFLPAPIPKLHDLLIALPPNEVRKVVCCESELIKVNPPCEGNESDDNSSIHESTMSSDVSILDDDYVIRLIVSKVADESCKAKRNSANAGLTSSLSVPDMQTPTLNKMCFISVEESKKVSESLNHGGDENEIVGELGNNSVARSSLKRLRPGEWLNDEIINFAMVLLNQAADDIDRDSNRFYCFNSHFIVKLLKEVGGCKHDNVKRWFRKANNRSLFDFDRVFFPINMEKEHWLFACVFIKEKDPML